MLSYFCAKGKPVSEEVNDRGDSVELDGGKNTFLLLLLLILTLFIFLLIIMMVVIKIAYEKALKSFAVQCNTMIEKKEGNLVVHEEL